MIPRAPGDRPRTVAITVILLALGGCQFAPSASQADDERDAGDTEVDSGIDASVDAGVDSGPPLEGCAAVAGYMPRPGSDHLYRKVDTPVSYDDAYAACSADGAHLIVIDDREENDFALALVGERVWIGLHDRTVDTSYQWVTGAAVGFTAWDTTKPGGAEGEDCILLAEDDPDHDTWHDFPCQDLYAFLCECDPTYTPPPVPLCMNDASYDIVVDGRRYRRGTQNRSWMAAQQECASAGAHLFVPADARENDAVVSAGPVDNPAWFGYTDAAQENDWVWVTGAPRGYEKWNRNEPNNSGGNEHCADARPQSSNDWNDADCNILQDYLCECDPGFVEPAP